MYAGLLPLPRHFLHRPAGTLCARFSWQGGGVYVNSGNSNTPGKATLINSSVYRNEATKHVCSSFRPPSLPPPSLLRYVLAFDWPLLTFCRVEVSTFLAHSPWQLPRSWPTALAQKVRISTWVRAAPPPTCYPHLPAFGRLRPSAKSGERRAAGKTLLAKRLKQAAK